MSYPEIPKPDDVLKSGGSLEQMDPRLIDLLATRNRGSKVYLFGTIMGISLGGVFCLAGFILAILGLNGNIEWIFEAGDVKSRLTNAGPGVFFALLGALIVWRYKPRVTDRFRVSPGEIESNTVMQIDIRHDRTE